MMFVRGALCILAAAGSSIPAAGWAQDGNDIVVTGQRELDRKEAVEAVRRIAQTTNYQMARYNGRVCPVVLGFQDKYEKLAAARIRKVAREAGAPLGRENCAPNLYLVVVDDGPAFVQALQRQYPEAFAALKKDRLEEILTAPGAARAWSTTTQTNDRGALVGGVVPEDEFIQPAMSGPANQPSGKIARVDNVSLFKPSTKSNIAASWVVLETRATLGKTLDQLADYAAFRGLAMVDAEEHEQQIDSILGLFAEGGQPAPGLTAFDRSYLSGLYRAASLATARTQIAQIGKAVSEGTTSEP